MHSISDLSSLSQISFVSGHYLFRYILQMYQRGIYSMLPIIQDSLFFINQQNHFFFLYSICTKGHYFHPNSRAFQWPVPMGHIFIPIIVQYGASTIPYIFSYLLLCTRHLPSHTFSMGHSLFPFLAAFVAH